MSIKLHLEYNLSVLCVLFQELCQDMDTQSDSFIPTVTAIATTPDFQWMVQPTIITSVSANLSSKPANSVQSSPRAASKVGGTKGKNSARKGKAEQVSQDQGSACCTL